MPVTVLMPALSPTMTEGTLARWLKKEGDAVTAGEVIAEIETDKAVMEIEAVDEGCLGKILVPDGSEGVPINQVIALILTDGEDESALESFSVSSETEIKQEAAHEIREPISAAKPVRGELLSVQSKDNDQQERIFASPLARRLAREAGIDITQIAAHSSGKRIVKADVERFLARRESSSRESAEASPVPEVYATTTPSSQSAVSSADSWPHRKIPHSSMRRAIARRLTESKQTVPHIYLSISCKLDNLIDLRQQLNEREGHISLNDFMIKAAALALQKEPAVNATWSNDAVLQWHKIDISVAVALPDGLITPIIRDANHKGLAEISSEIKDMAARAREGKLHPRDYEGGTFTISNLGMFGVEQFQAILNPPQAGILAIGRGSPQPVVSDGKIEIATMAQFTLSVDHRVVDGAIGATWLASFKRLIEDPLTMLL